jgi:hypothetical protein
MIKWILIGIAVLLIIIIALTLYSCLVASGRSCRHDDELLRQHKLDALTLDDCVNAMDEGYETILNDGHLLGFVKAE